MKKLIVIAATAFVSLSSYASVDPVTGRVLESFRSTFAEAKNVQWKSLNNSDSYQVSFIYRETELTAFYNADGELTGTARYITVNNVPFMITKAIGERYPEHIIKDVIEHTDGGTITYHLTLHGQKNSMIVSANASGSLTVFKKVKNKL